MLPLVYFNFFYCEYTPRKYSERIRMEWFNAHLFSPIHICWSPLIRAFFILVENVEQFLQLSDEYPVTEHIFKPCVKILEDEPKTKENVMEILALAELCELNKVRQDCNKLLSGMKIKTLAETVQLVNVEKGRLQHFLTQRIEVLEGCLDELYPQFMGLLECCLWLWRHENHRCLEWRPTHFSCGKAKTNLDKCIKECVVCQKC